MFTVGKKAPAFSLTDQYGETRTLKDEKGNWLLLYFYPKDDTPGCTQEACTIAEVYSDFKRLRVTVFGVSKDTVRSHKKFAEKYSLPFTLLSDPTMTMMDEYGALVMKKMYGKDVRGTRRISYLINPEGKIAQVYLDVDPATHAVTLLRDIKLIQKATKKVSPSST